MRSLLKADPTSPQRDSYEKLASEYYDARLHPTCANFREASAQLLARWLAPVAEPDVVFCDVGCGKSLVAELLVKQLGDLGNVTLIDAAPSMLAYSLSWARFGAHLILGDAERLPLQSHSVDVLVSSLGDPFNTATFWREAQRVTRQGGHALFTTPAYDWAKAFRPRSSDDMQLANFELRDGHHVDVPSYVRPIDVQIGLQMQHGFAIRETSNVPISNLRANPISPKLMTNRGLDASVVTGYSLTRLPS